MPSRIRSWLTNSACKAITGYTLSDFANRFARAGDQNEGASEDGVYTDKPYMQSVWVHAAINLIARSVALVPMVLKQEGSDDIVTNHPALQLANRPNRDQHFPEFVTELLTRLLLNGHTFVERREMEGTRPKAVHVVGIDKVYPDTRINSVGDEYAFRWMRSANGEPLIAGDEIHEWKLFNPYSDLYGLAPISPAALALYCDVATGVYNKAFFKNGARADVVFSTDDQRFTQEQADAARDRWNSRHRGAARGKQTTFMGNGLKPHVVGYTFSDMEFPELKRMSKGEILAIFGVPDTLLGAQAASAGVQIGGTGRRTDAEHFYINTVMPWGRYFCWFWDEVVTSTYGPGLYSEFDWRQVPTLQDRRLDLAKEARNWTKCGATFNDVNEKFGLGFKAQPTGDDWWVPSNMLPARLLMGGPLAADPGRAQTDSADAKDAKKALHLLEVA